MFPESVYFLILGSIVGSYLFANLFAFLLRFITRNSYTKRLVIGTIITIIAGGMFNAFGAGEGEFSNRTAFMMANGLWYIWSGFYGGMAMLGIYFTVRSLSGKTDDRNL